MGSKKELTRDIIALIIVVGTITSLFIPTISATGQNLLYGLTGVVAGFYFGIKTLPVVGVIKKK